MSYAIPLYLTGITISWFIFYYVVKTAVKNGIREARSDKEVSTTIRESKPDRSANEAQTKLQQRYDKGEITFVVYQSEWNKLST